MDKVSRSPELMSWSHAMPQDIHSNFTPKRNAKMPIRLTRVTANIAGANASKYQKRLVILSFTSIGPALRHSKLLLLQLSPLLHLSSEQQNEMFAKETISTPRLRRTMLGMPAPTEQ